jgi:dephospho-CoA kinase
MSVRITITGGRGSGKSTVLNLLEKILVDVGCRIDARKEHSMQVCDIDFKRVSEVANLRKDGLIR